MTCVIDSQERSIIVGYNYYLSKNMKKLIVLLLSLAFFISGCGTDIATNEAEIYKEYLQENNVYFNDQWAIYNNGQDIEDSVGVDGVDINIIDSWEVSKGSPDVIIGILDTGIGIDNAEISDSIYLNLGEIGNNGIDDDGNGYIDDTSGWDFYNGDQTVFDSAIYDYHGTYIAGTISSSHDSGTICGVCPESKILPLKFMSGTEGTIDNAIEAIEYGYSMGVRIFNCSWDTTTYNQELKDVISKYSDCLFVCSAGKYKQELKEVPAYPASYELDNIMSVGAIDNTGELYEFSGYGDGVDIYAPGESIIGLLTDDENDTVFADGSSISTAFVTGVAAILMGQDKNLSVSQIKSILINTATQYGAAGNYPVVNCSNALNYIIG